MSPAILACTYKPLVNGMIEGMNIFVCLESRTDAKLLMWNLSTGRNNTQHNKKDPVKTFFDEAIFCLNKKSAPDRHNKVYAAENIIGYTALTHSDNPGNKPGSAADMDTEKPTNPFTAVTDIDRNSHRLDMWPDKDQIVNYEQGKHLFEDSINRNTEFETIPDCSRVFHADGTSIVDLIRHKAREYLLGFSPPSLP